MWAAWSAFNQSAAHNMIPLPTEIAHKGVIHNAHIQQAHGLAVLMFLSELSF